MRRVHPREPSPQATIRPTRALQGPPWISQAPQLTFLLDVRQEPPPDSRSQRLPPEPNLSLHPRLAAPRQHICSRAARWPTPWERLPDSSGAVTCGHKVPEARASREACAWRAPKSVVFPAPLGPRRALSVPARMRPLARLKMCAPARTVTVTSCRSKRQVGAR